MYIGVGVFVEFGVVYGVEGRLEWFCCVFEVVLVNKMFINVEFNLVLRFLLCLDFEGCVDFGVVVIFEDWFVELFVVVNFLLLIFVDEFWCLFLVLIIFGFSDWVDFGNVSKGEEWFLFVLVLDVFDLIRLFIVDVLLFLFFVSGLVVVGNKLGLGICFFSGIFFLVVLDGWLILCLFS